MSTDDRPTQSPAPPRRDVKMPVVYIAGPYRAPTEFEVVRNIRRAEEVAVELWRSGCAVVCPHLNTALLGGAVPDDTFIDGDLAILSRCDGLVTVVGWNASVGARAEVAQARHLGIPVLESWEEVRWWVGQGWPRNWKGPPA